MDPHRYNPWTPENRPDEGRREYYRQYHARNREKRIEQMKRRQREKGYPQTDRRDYWRARYKAIKHQALNQD